MKHGVSGLLGRYVSVLPWRWAEPVWKPFLKGYIRMQVLDFPAALPQVEGQASMNVVVGLGLVPPSRGLGDLMVEVFVAKGVSDGGCGS